MIKHYLAGVFLTAAMAMFAVRTIAIHSAARLADDATVFSYLVGKLELLLFLGFLFLLFTVLTFLFTMRQASAALFTAGTSLLVATRIAAGQFSVLRMGEPFLRQNLMDDLLPTALFSILLIAISIATFAGDGIYRFIMSRYKNKTRNA